MEGSQNILTAKFYVWFFCGKGFSSNRFFVSCFLLFTRASFCKKGVSSWFFFAKGLFIKLGGRFNKTPKNQKKFENSKTRKNSKPRKAKKTEKPITKKFEKPNTQKIRKTEKPQKIEYPKTPKNIEPPKPKKNQKKIESSENPKKSGRHDLKGSWLGISSGFVWFFCGILFFSILLFSSRQGKARSRSPF